MFETVPRDVGLEAWIASQDKVVRIIMDYIESNPGIHDTVFTEFRCLRCE